VTAGTSLLVDVVAGGLPEPEPQVGEPTYAEKITVEDLRLDWQLPAEHLHRVVRVGRAWTTFRGRRLLVLRARPVEGDLAPGLVEGLRVGTGAGALELVEVQPEGRQPQGATAWARGARLAPGDRMGG
jgi:methionyl-tRNA formyltransferase